MFRKNSAAEKKLEEFVEEHKEISITVMTIAELYYGAYKSDRSDEEKEKIEQIKRNFLILEINENGAQKFGELLNKLEKSGKKILTEMS